jgi:hypothetical protein
MPTKTVFAVKKAATGRYILTIEVITTSGWLLNLKRERSIETYDDLDRVVVVTDASSSEIPKPIPPDIDRQPNTYCLRFKAAKPRREFQF